MVYPPAVVEVGEQEIAAHTAYKVIPDVAVGEYGKVITDPPSVNDQPDKVYPARVGAVGADEIEPPVTKLPLETEVPPLLS